MSVNISLSSRSIAAFGMIFVPVFAAMVTWAISAPAATGAPTAAQQRCQFSTTPAGAQVITCPRAATK